MNRQPEVREKTREKIFEAFFVEYKKNTLRGVTVGAVSKRAHVNRSTFYEYFSDIYDLLDQAEESLLAKLQDRINELRNEQADEQVRHFTMYGEEIIQEYGERLAVLLSHGDTGFSTKMVRVMGPTLTEAFHIDVADPSSKLLISFVLSGITGYITTWYSSEKIVPMHDMVTMLQTIMGYVLSMLKNQARYDFLENITTQQSPYIGNK